MHKYQNVEIQFKETATYCVKLDDLPDKIIEEIMKKVKNNEIQCYGDLNNYLYEMGIESPDGKYFYDGYNELTMDDNNGMPTTDLFIEQNDKSLFITNSVE